MSDQGFTLQKSFAERLPHPQSVASHLLGFWLKRCGWLGLLVFAAFLGAVTGFWLLRPQYGWDTLPYLAAALSNAEMSFEAVHAHVYSLMREVVSPEAFAALSEGDLYRARQFTDPDAFRSMLGMYEVKWLYVKLLSVLAASLGPFGAVKAINLFAVGLIFVSTWAWSSRHRLAAYLPLAAAGFLVARFPDLVMQATPDLLALAFALSALFALDRGRVIGASVALVLMVLARPDMVVLPALLALALMAVRDVRAAPMALAALASVAAYLFATASGNHPGFWPHLWFSTYQIQNTMVGFHPDFSLTVYLTAFGYNLARAATENVWLGLWAFGVIGWIVMVAKGRGEDGARTAIAGACLVAVAAKFVIFPLHDGRTYLPILLPGLMLLAAGLTPWLSRTARYNQSI